MHCELVIPGLFSARAAPRFAALELLLARGRKRTGAQHSLEQWLQEHFEIEDPFPAGALTLLASGTDPGEAIWARADPVHLRVMRDHVLLVPAQAFELSREEADALCEALNRHFEELNFSVSEPRRWCARVAGEIGAKAHPLELAGEEIRPASDTAALLNEVQMVLHEHPVNEAREARGEPAVNSVWLWGAGRATGAHCVWHSVAADDPAALGAARLAGARYRPLPRSAHEWLQRLPEEGRHLAVLDALRAPLAFAKEAVQNEIQMLERDWFAPLLAALRAERIGMVTVHVPDSAEALSFETIRGDLRRFWRLAKPIEHYA